MFTEWHKSVPIHKYAIVQLQDLEEVSADAY